MVDGAGSPLVVRRPTRLASSGVDPEAQAHLIVETLAGSPMVGGTRRPLGVIVDHSNLSVMDKLRLCSAIDRRLAARGESNAATRLMAVGLLATGGPYSGGPATLARNDVLVRAGGRIPL